MRELLSLERRVERERGRKMNQKTRLPLFILRLNRSGLLESDRFGLLYGGPRPSLPRWAQFPSFYFYTPFSYYCTPHLVIEPHFIFKSCILFFLSFSIAFVFLLYSLMHILGLDLLLFSYIYLCHLFSADFRMY